MIIKHSNTSNIIRFTIKNSSTGVGLTELTEASAGLIISTICNNEATATTYTQAGSTIETIAALGTYAAPTATKCRFKEVDATNHKGLYEFQIADARYAIASARSVVISVTGASNLLDADYEIQLVSFDPHDAVRMGMTSLPNAVVDAAGGLPISDAGGLDLDAKLANTNEVTAARMGALTDWINGGRLDLLLDAIPTTAMRGTDGANTTEPDASGTAAGLHANTDALVDEVETILKSATYGLAALETLVDDLETRCTEARLSELDVGTSGKLAYQLDKMMIALVNKMIVTEANGNTEQFNDAGVTLGSVLAAFSSDGTYTTRKRLVI